VRAAEVLVCERLGRDDLRARRFDGSIERVEQPACVAVGGDHDVIRVQVVEGRHG
jgi:hypothetical protein